jgi:hypothetical protein
LVADHRKDLAVKTSRILLTLLALCAASVPALAQLNDTYVIPAAANQGGAFGTNWSTQFSIFNPHLDHDLVVSVVFIPQGGARGLEQLVEVPANSLAWSDNILADLFGVRGAGALLVATFQEDNPGVPNNVLARSFLVTSNTYNDSREGTFGSSIAGVWTGLLDYDYDEISGVAHNIRHDNRTGWRTNVGAVNLGRCSVTLNVNVYDADGNTIYEAPFGIPPMAHFQDVLPSGLHTEAASVEFFVDDPCSASDENYAVVFPYTTTIDVLSGDPKYQVPTLLAAPGTIFSQKKGSVMTQAARTTDPAQFGRKIDSNYARGVRAAAIHNGLVTLKKEAKGYRLAK